MGFCIVHVGTLFKLTNECQRIFIYNYKRIRHETIGMETRAYSVFIDALSYLLHLSWELRLTIFFALDAVVLFCFVFYQQYSLSFAL